MKNYIRFVVVVLFALIAVNVSAQSAGDRLFAQGQKYQMKQTVKSQNLAIAKFRSAKAAYDSATIKTSTRLPTTPKRSNRKRPSPSASPSSCRSLSRRWSLRLPARRTTTTR